MHHEILLKNSISRSMDGFIHHKFVKTGLDASERARMRTRLNPPRDMIIENKDHAVVIGSERSTQ